MVAAYQCSEPTRIADPFAPPYFEPFPSAPPPPARFLSPRGSPSLPPKQIGSTSTQTLAHGLAQNLDRLELPTRNEGTLASPALAAATAAATSTIIPELLVPLPLSERPNLGPVRMASVLRPHSRLISDPESTIFYTIEADEQPLPQSAELLVKGQIARDSLGLLGEWRDYLDPVCRRNNILKNTLAWSKINLPQTFGCFDGCGLTGLGRLKLYTQVICKYLTLPLILSFQIVSIISKPVRWLGAYAIWPWLKDTGFGQKLASWYDWLPTMNTPGQLSFFARWFTDKGIMETMQKSAGNEEFADFAVNYYKAKKNRQFWMEVQLGLGIFFSICIAVPMLQGIALLMPPILGLVCFLRAAFGVVPLDAYSGVLDNTVKRDLAEVAKFQQALSEFAKKIGLDRQVVERELAWQGYSSSPYIWGAHTVGIFATLINSLSFMDKLGTSALAICSVLGFTVTLPVIVSVQIFADFFASKTPRWVQSSLLNTCHNYERTQRLLQAVLEKIAHDPELKEQFAAELPMARVA